MLKKLTIICLVISTFGYGMAWAVDGHWDALHTQADAPFGPQANGDNPLPGEQHNAGCDHCCHANAHFVGIVAAGTEGLSAHRNKTSSADAAAMISFLHIPSLPPPKH